MRMKSSKWWILAVVAGSQAVMWGVGLASERIGMAAPQSAASPVARPKDAPRMTISQLVQRQKEAKAPIVIDVREAGEYETGHIAGAINVPFATLDKWAAEQKADQKKRSVVLYCACATEHSAAVGATKLRNLGFADTWALKGGWRLWQQEQKPVKSGKLP
jgi:rhodanese-related sulfurtransferase